MSQFRSPERATLAHIQKKRWSKAEGKLRKILQQDTTNAVGKYLYSLYFFKRDNPAYRPDSAYQYILGALADFGRASPRSRDKMKRFHLDSARLILHRAQIDSVVFEDTRAINTEQAYIAFLQRHTFATQRGLAMELRDEVAYLDAVKKNTHEAFLDYLKKYPASAKAGEAQTKYDRLLYEESTRENKLSAFENFLRQHPETPFRKEAEKNIFELFTLSGEVERYLSFMSLYPESSQLQKAHNILFHILHEQEEAQWPGLFLSDSLQRIRHLQESYLAPFLKNGKFGFMDKNGAEVIRPFITSLHDEYKCGNINDDIIVLSDSILARDGHVLYKGEVEEIDDLGLGFLKVKSDSCQVLLHKSGFIVQPCVQNARILGNKFLAILNDRRWSIYSLTGRAMLPNEWDEIVMNGNVIGLRKVKTWHLLTREELTALAEAKKVSLSDPYSDVKFLPDGKVWVSSKSRQAILDQTLSEIIAMNEQEIVPSFFGFVSRSSEGYTIYDRSGRGSSHFERVLHHEPWIAVRKNRDWFAFDPDQQQYKSKAYDSVRFEGPFLLGFHADTMAVHFTPGIQEFARPVKAYFIPGKDSTSFLVTEIEEKRVVNKRRGTTETERKKTVYTLKGKPLFTVTYDEIRYAGQNLFIVSRKEKKGLMDATGNLLVPVEFDAIGSVSNNMVSLLTKMKFGLYQVERQQLINPGYDKNLIPYNNENIVAYHEGQYGFIGWDNKLHGDYAFEEIRYWNDTTALVKKKGLWSFYEIATHREVMSGIKDIEIFHDALEEKTAVIQRDDYYGVVSSTRGMVIPLAFSDLVNIGSNDEPLFFTEKHVPEASLFVVIYYDKNGKFLRREVYQEADDYEKIYCQQ
jgi:hypothetical protein